MIARLACKEIRATNEDKPDETRTEIEKRTNRKKNESNAEKKRTTREKKKSTRRQERGLTALLAELGVFLKSGVTLGAAVLGRGGGRDHHHPLATVLAKVGSLREIRGGERKETNPLLSNTILRLFVALAASGDHPAAAATAAAVAVAVLWRRMTARRVTARRL
jgi:hypothetical protein